MSTSLAKELFGWGFLLWLVGYLLGIVLIAFVPSSAIGWLILPIGVCLTWWVLTRRIPRRRPAHYVLIGIVWMAIAIVLDYFLIVRAFHPADGYYKLDVYVYYLLTLGLPIVVGMRNESRLSSAAT